MKGEKSMKWVYAALYTVYTAIFGAYTVILVGSIINDYKNSKEEEQF